MAPWWLDATSRNPQCFRKDKGLAELFKVHITFIPKCEKKKTLLCRSPQISHLMSLKVSKTLSRIESDSKCLLRLMSGKRTPKLCWSCLLKSQGANDETLQYLKSRIFGQK